MCKNEIVTVQRLFFPIIKAIEFKVFKHTHCIWNHAAAVFRRGGRETVNKTNVL